MDYKEAYKLLLKKFPDKQSNHYTDYKDLYIFQLWPTKKEELKEIQDQIDAGIMYDNTWSVNKENGDIQKYNLYSDPLKFAMFMDALEAGEASQVDF